MPSVAVNVAEYERANYSTLGDLLTTITASHQHIIATQDCDSARNYNIILSHPPARAPCLVTAGDSGEL